MKDNFIDLIRLIVIMTILSFSLCLPFIGNVLLSVFNVVGLYVLSDLINSIFISDKKE